MSLQGLGLFNIYNLFLFAYPNTTLNLFILYSIPVSISNKREH